MSSWDQTQQALIVLNYFQTFVIDLLFSRMESIIVKIKSGACSSNDLHTYSMFLNMILYLINLS